jgi:hypothetical protein
MVKKIKKTKQKGEKKKQKKAKMIPLDLPVLSIDDLNGTLEEADQDEALSDEKQLEKDIKKAKKS